MVTTQIGLTGDLALGLAEEDINLVVELVQIQAQHRVAKIVQKLDRLLKAKTVELRHVLVSINIDFTLHLHITGDRKQNNTPLRLTASFWKLFNILPYEI